ncbi:hemerythrin domain-containing protein [Nocardia nova]|jgi:iron-sulfur cluster repair protein YtfE (RIC family)|nr:hemerythrin domain-containing protein [Nocardia nova]
MTIDFAVMYATHDAFRRDLRRLSVAAESGRADSPGVEAGWSNFVRQLHVHHTVEDTALWPQVIAAVPGRPDHLALMAEMEAEHAALDPALAAVEDALARRAADLPEHIDTLSTILGEHMAHEENSALPLIQEVLTPKDWDTFRSAMARKQGPSGAAVYIPWVLDDTTPDQRRRFLAAMPGPVAVANQLVLRRRYNSKALWR